MPFKDPEKQTEYFRQYRKNHRELMLKANRKYRENNVEKTRIRHLVNHYSELYPLDDKRIFCGIIRNLEHGHLDYKDQGYNYVTVCHQCNVCMDIPIGMRGE